MQVLFAQRNNIKTERERETVQILTVYNMAQSAELDDDNI